MFPAWISTPTSQAVAKKRTFQIPRSITHTHNTRYARKIKEKNKTRKGKQEKGKQEKTRTSKTPVEKKETQRLRAAAMKRKHLSHK